MPAIFWGQVFFLIREKVDNSGSMNVLHVAGKSGGFTLHIK